MAFRLLQGVGGALVTANSGAIVTYVSWRWIFWINVPIGLLGVGLARRLLHDRGQPERHLEVHDDEEQASRLPGPRAWVAHGLAADRRLDES